MEKIFFWFRSFRKVKTVQQAQNMGLIHETNIFGDGINFTNCRSFWKDKYGHTYRCDELLENGRDIVMEQIQKEYPTLFNRVNKI